MRFANGSVALTESWIDEWFGWFIPRLKREGRLLEFWWRDDDLADGDDRLPAFIEVSRQLGIAPLVAVVPGLRTAAAVLAADMPAGWSFAQHGWKHLNHDPAGQGNSEFGELRPPADVHADLVRGREIMMDQFADRYLDVFVPPWYRFADNHETLINTVGYRGFSGGGLRVRANLAPDVIQAGSHVDLLEWSPDGSAVLCPPDKLKRRLNQPLRQRGVTGSRNVRVGVLSHHRVTPDAIWDYFSRFVEKSRTYDIVRWIDPRDVFPAPPDGGRHAGIGF
jgi:hypothetical protein